MIMAEGWPEEALGAIAMPARPAAIRVLPVIVKLPVQ